MARTEMPQAISFNELSIQQVPASQNSTFLLFKKKFLFIAGNLKFLKCSLCGQYKCEHLKPEPTKVPSSGKTVTF